MASLLNVSHYYQRPGVHPVPRTIREGEQLVELVTGGRGWVEHRGEWIEVVRGMLLWHVAGDTTIGRSDFDSPYRCLAVLLDVDDGTRPVPRISRWGAAGEMKAFVSEVLSRFLDETFDRHALLAYTRGTLLYHATVYHHNPPVAEAPGGLRKVLAAIEEHYDRALQVRDLAEAAGWSVPHLHAVFRSHLRSSPHQVLIRRRLQAVREKLAMTDLPIKQIADECGFANAAALCRAFRQATGTTPGAFRRSRTHPWPAD